MEDIYNNAVRNEKEYAFDGNNWRTAREESDFLRCSSISSSSPEELVHPVHFNGWSTYPQPSWNNEQSLSSTQRSEVPSPKNGEDKNAPYQVDDVESQEGMFEMD